MELMILGFYLVLSHWIYYLSSCKGLVGFIINHQYNFFLEDAFRFMLVEMNSSSYSFEFLKFLSPACHLLFDVRLVCSRGLAFSKLAELGQ